MIWRGLLLAGTAALVGAQAPAPSAVETAAALGIMLQESIGREALLQVQLARAKAELTATRTPSAGPQVQGDQRK